MDAFVLFCPVCGQGMFIKKNSSNNVFTCIGENCKARLRVVNISKKIVIEEVEEAKEKKEMVKINKN